MRLMRPPLLDWLGSKVVVEEEEGAPLGQAWRAREIKKTFSEPAFYLNRLCNVLVVGAADEVPYEVN